MAIREVADLLDEGARLHGVEAKHLPHAAQLVHATLTAPLALTDGHALPPLADATQLAREVEFAFPVPAATEGAPTSGIVKGYIDALVAYGDELWVLDYKSDALPGTGAELTAAAYTRVQDKYGVQMRLYALAAARMAGSRRFAGMLFAFVRYGQVVPVRVDDATLASWSAWLAALGEARS
jgi:ATP-dependent exoDNAse (exonuclease V) beta subunit